MRTDTPFRKGATGPVLLAVVSLMWGCGGGDSTTTVIQEAPSEATTGATQTTTADHATEQGPTEAEYIAAMDRICRRVNPQFEQFDSVNRAFVRLWKQSDAQMQALGVPPSLEIKAEQYATALADQLHFMRVGNTREARAADHRKEEVAREIGFAECGTG